MRIYNEVISRHLFYTVGVPKKRRLNTVEIVLGFTLTDALPCSLKYYQHDISELT